MEQTQREVASLETHLRTLVEESCASLTPELVREIFLMLCLRPSVASALAEHSDPWMREVSRLFFSSETPSPETTLVGTALLPPKLNISPAPDKLTATEMEALRQDLKDSVDYLQANY